MTDPTTLLLQIEQDAAWLDEASKGLFEACAALDEAEAKWEACFDLIMEDLEDEFGKSGRKSVPEHTAVSAARRKHRTEWATFRQAKRRVERLQRQLKAKEAALSGRQSQLRAMGAEVAVQDHVSQRGPQRTPPTFGRQAA